MKKAVVVLRSGFSLLALCTLTHGFQQEGGSAVSAQEKDVYSIYSLMLTNPQTSHGPDNNERYLIAMFTAPTYPEPCLPTERDADRREMCTDYEQRKATPRQLKPTFSISKPYVLLSTDEAKTFIQFLNQSRIKPGQVPIERFKGVTDLFTLSDVYFNKRGTLALTGISTSCGFNCGLFQWKVFERLSSGKWEERSTSTAIANNWGGIGSLSHRHS